MKPDQRCRLELTGCEGSEVLILITLCYLQISVRISPKFSSPQRFSLDLPDQVGQAGPDVVGGEDIVTGREVHTECGHVNGPRARGRLREDREKCWGCWECRAATRHNVDTTGTPLMPLDKTNHTTRHQHLQLHRFCLSTLLFSLLISNECILFKFF